MPKYRKKPVVIEAFQMTEERRLSNSEWPNWLHAAWHTGVVTPATDAEGGIIDGLFIHTLEGVHLCCFDDWIIQGVKGELYPCKPDIFAATYEPA